MNGTGGFWVGGAIARAYWACFGVLLLVAGLSAPARPWTGAGVWSWRLALTLSVMGITSAAMGGLFYSSWSPLFLMGLLVIGGGVLILSKARAFDLFGLSALALGLNVLLVSGLGRLLLQGVSGDALLSWLLVGLVAAGLLAVTVQWVLRVAHRHAPPVSAAGGVA